SGSGLQTSTSIEYTQVSSSSATGSLGRYPGSSGPQSLIRPVSRPCDFRARSTGTASSRSRVSASTAATRSGCARASWERVGRPPTASVIRRSAFAGGPYPPRALQEGLVQHGGEGPGIAAEPARDVVVGAPTGHGSGEGTEEVEQHSVVR